MGYSGNFRYEPEKVSIRYKEYLSKDKGPSSNNSKGKFIPDRGTSKCRS